MSAETDYLRAERESLLRTLGLIDDLLQKESRSQYETIARSVTSICHDFLRRLV